MKTGYRYGDYRKTKHDLHIIISAGLVPSWLGLLGRLGGVSWSLQNSLEPRQASELSAGLRAETLASFPWVLNPGFTARELSVASACLAQNIHILLDSILRSQCPRIIFFDWGPFGVKECGMPGPHAACGNSRPT